MRPTPDQDGSLLKGNGGAVSHDDLKSARILIVDDEEPNVRLLERMLTKVGYESLTTTTDSREACRLFQELEPDLVLLDLNMPHLDGFEVMAAIRADLGGPRHLPVLVLTGDSDPDIQSRALLAGARDFVAKPFSMTEALLRIGRLLETNLLHRQLKDHNDNLQAKVRERTEALENAKVEILNRLARAAEYRDDITGRHAERVGIISALIAEALGDSLDDVELIRRAAPLHDVGKIAVPDSILMKPGPLTTEEFEVIKSHTTIGAEILSGSEFPVLQLAEVIAMAHHERWAGGGYPRGLQGEDIPLVGRIVAVADVYDSITNERPYKKASTPERAAELIRVDRGQHFDPRVVDAFLDLLQSGRIARMVAEMHPPTNKKPMTRASRMHGGDLAFPSPPPVPGAPDQATYGLASA